jgi:hypothetical protein
MHVWKEQFQNGVLVKHIERQCGDDAWERREYKSGDKNRSCALRSDGGTTGITSSHPPFRTYVRLVRIYTERNAISNKQTHADIGT